MTLDHRNLPLVVGSPRPSGRPGPSALRLTAPFAAQLLGQGGAGRGLKGGAELPGDARIAYLSREHSGEGERRLPPGIFRRTAV